MKYGEIKTDQDKAFYAYCLIEAQKDKQWAINKKAELKGGEWTEASNMSQTMLKDRLEQSVEQIAQDKYAYLRMRAHAYYGGKNFARPIDSLGFKNWTEVTGQEPIFEIL